MSHGPAVYERREPEHTVLWRCVREHLPAFLSRAADTGGSVPAHVRDELERFLTCGILEEGFARIACEHCGFERLVPFSCKGRGICPSCIARRMSDTAAHLVDHVIPSVPMRQWVLSLPMPLRYLLAWQPELVAAVSGIFVEAVFRHLRRVAKRELPLRRQAEAHAGAVCMVQRYGSAVNLNVHLHVLATDGVFVVGEGGRPEFRALPAPSRAEIGTVAWEVCERVVALLRKRGQWLDAPGENDALAETEPLLAQLYAASISGTLVMGPNAGRRQLRVFGVAARDPDEDRSHAKNGYGFDLDASVRVPAHDRKRLEGLLRYMLRPPLSRSRLERLEDGRYRIKLKKGWSDGTTHIVLDGVELIGRLAALVPPPRAHLTRYYGVFAPRAKLRRAIVPEPQLMDGGCACSASSATPIGTVAAAEKGRQRRLSWAALLARVFAVDVLKCNRCGSSMQRVEWCTRPDRIKAVLKSTGPPGLPAVVERAA